MNLCPVCIFAGLTVGEVVIHCFRNQIGEGRPLSRSFPI